MRFAVLLLVICVAADAKAGDRLSPGSTGKTWAATDWEAHQAWAQQFGNYSMYEMSWNLIETCLDHITSDEDGNVPRHVAKESLQNLTWWCRFETDKVLERIRADSGYRLHGLTFKYPK